MSISDSLSYFYIKKIKRWMHCPICNNKMFFNTNSSNWICDGCKYSLSETEFLDDYIFFVFFLLCAFLFRAIRDIIFCLYTQNTHKKRPTLFDTSVRFVCILLFYRIYKAKFTEREILPFRVLQSTRRTS